MRDVLVVGAGGREHALAWKLRQSPEVGRLYVAPGNPGTATVAENVPLEATDIGGICRWCRDRAIGLVVIGAEAPLVAGLADALRAEGISVVGPNAAAARLESSKAFAKDLMARCHIPTAAYAVFDDLARARAHVEQASYPLVVKADGLAGGKGVAICTDVHEAERALHVLMAEAAFGESGRTVLIEEMLQGIEASAIGLVDGRRVVPFPLAQDHKRLSDGDTGPNTGGMGAIAPAPPSTREELSRLTDLALVPVIEALAEAGTPYRGILFAGLIFTADGPRVLEYNCRFGDPETQVLLPLIQGDLLPWLVAVAEGELDGTLPLRDGSAAGVVLAAPGYPGQPEIGTPIEGLDGADDDILIFQAGTALDAQGRVVTAGGRVLTVVGRGETLAQALHRAYDAPVRFPGMQRRLDIGRQMTA